MAGRMVAGRLHLFVVRFHSTAVSSGWVSEISLRGAAGFSVDVQVETGRVGRVSRSLQAERHEAGLS